MMRRSEKDGFTLLEILVAVAIMIVILLIVSQVFQQTSSAWEAGRRKTSLNMDGRAILALISEELSQAVASPTYTNGIASGPMIMFHTSSQGVDGERHIRRVQYDAMDNITIFRSCWTYDVTKKFPGLNDDPSSIHVELISGCDLDFVVPDNGPPVYEAVLPPWIDIYLTLDSSGGEVSTVRVWSDGPSGGAPIRSWESKM